MTQFRSETLCLFCTRRFDGFGTRGVCPACKSKHPAVIPQNRLSRDDVVLGPGYVMNAEGAVRYDLSAVARLKGDAPNVFVPESDPFASAPNRQKRTRQERLDSLHARMASFFNKGGVIPPSIIKEIQAEQIASGHVPMTDTQVRQLAAVYLERAEKTPA